MGEIILNGKSYNSGMKYKEVTQAEYNALPSSKLTDGTLYCITDAPGPGEGFPPMIYSYEEREVGVWVDGKPLYQKTIAVTFETSNTVYEIESNIDKFMFVPEATFKIQNSSYNVTNYGFYVSATDRVQVYYRPSDHKLIVMSVSSDIAGNGFITYRYTKTTDTPGSGIWTTDGIPTVHYSTNEKVIGIWTDGKPLYEMTIIKSRVGSPAASRDYVNVEDLSSANIDKLIRAEGSWFDGGVMRKAFPWADSGASLNICYNQNTKYLQILFYGFTGYDIYDVYMIIQYTKTTD